MYALLLAVIYLAFISLGLPDSLLGAGWPVMHEYFGVSLSSAGIISMLISGGTIISGLASERLTKKLGTKYVTLISVFMTAVALLGFSMSTHFWMLIIWTIPYGLGAGSIDAALNNYVALHYNSRHMSWLHCFWGVGTIISPYVMSYALTYSSWQTGYRTVACIQFGIAFILLATLRLWRIHDNVENASAGYGNRESKKDVSSADSESGNKDVNSADSESGNKDFDVQAIAEEAEGHVTHENESIDTNSRINEYRSANKNTEAHENENKNEAASSDNRVLGVSGAVKIAGVPSLLIGFMCYCAAESTCMLWTASYLIRMRGVSAEKAAAFASLFFIGITAGRFLAGFISGKLGDRNMIRLGTSIIAVGIIMTAIPMLPENAALAGFVVIGLGCAPVYPSIIHSTPSNFGAENSQAIIGIQMASAYVGSTLAPPLFGLLSAWIGMWIMPVYITLFVAVMIYMVERTFSTTK